MDVNKLHYKNAQNFKIHFKTWNWENKRELTLTMLLWVYFFLYITGMNFKKDMIKYLRKTATDTKQESKGKHMKMSSPASAAGLPTAHIFNFVAEFGTRSKAVFPCQ